MNPPTIIHPSKASVANRSNRRFHNAVFFIIPLLLTVRLIWFNGMNWQQQMLFEPFHHECGNCSCPPESLAKTKQREIAEPKGSKSTDDAEITLSSVLESLQTTNAKLLRGSDGVNPSSPVRTRSFPRRNTSFPCYESEDNWRAYDSVQRTSAHQGFFYVKTFKTASTTVMGITIRIALKSWERDNRFPTGKPCKVRFEHWPAYRLGYRNRKREKSFLFAVLREPTHRAISMYVTGKKECNDN